MVVVSLSPPRVFFFSFCFVVVSCLPDKTSCRLLLFFVKKRKISIRLKCSCRTDSDKQRQGPTPCSAGWLLVAGLIWRERKTLLIGWLAGG